ncbi:unnamed protein product [Calicophoron daubneyi]|uniref:Uncharacterized protein n=1 Tax=Calicophoron daubneyi TaxID=300641 RepID=A0AAV2TP92_CALDB
MTIPMHAQGLLTLNMTPNSTLDDMSSQSSTLSFISSSPASRHSSQETVAMRLLSPSPPPLGKDASIESLNSAPLSGDLNISSFHYLRYSIEGVNNEQSRRRSRHTSEPVCQPMLDSGGPLLRRREQSFNSLSDYLGEASDKEAVPLDVIAIQPMAGVEEMKSQELLCPILSQLQTLPEHSELIEELAATDTQICSESQFELPIKAQVVKIELGLALITDHLCCESTKPLCADTQPVRATVTTVPVTAQFVVKNRQVEVHINTGPTHSAHQSPSVQVSCDDAVVEQIRLDLKNSFEDSTSPSAKSLYGHDDLRSSGCGDVPLKSYVYESDSCNLLSPVIDARTQLHVKLPPSKLSPDEFLRPHSSFVLPPNETPSAYSSPGSLSFLPNRPNRRQTLSAQNTVKKNQLKFPSFARSQTRARQSLSFSFDRSTSVPGICISKTGIECRRTDDVINSSCVYSSLNLSPYSYTEAPFTPHAGAPAHSPAPNRCSSVGQLKFTRSPRTVQNELTQIIEQRSSIFAFTPESDRPDAEIDEELSGSSDFVSPDVNHLASGLSPSSYQGSFIPSVSDNNHGCLFPLPTSPFDADYGRSTFTHVPSSSVPPQSTYITPVTFHSPKPSVLDAPPGSTFSPIPPPVSSQPLGGARKPISKSRQVKPNTLPRRQRRQAKSSVGDHSYVGYVTPSSFNPSTATSWIGSQRMTNSVLTPIGTPTASPATLPVSPGGMVVVGAPTAFVQQHTNLTSPVRAFSTHTLRPASAISVYDDATRADTAFCINQSPYYNPAGTLTSDQELHDIHQFESYPSVQYSVLPPQTSEGGNLSYPVCPTDPHLPINTTLLETSTIQPQTNFAFLSPNSSSIPQFVVQSQSSLIAPPQSSIPCSINSGVFSTLVPLGQSYGTNGPCEFLLEKSMHPLVGPDQPIYGQQQHCPQRECAVSPSPRISLSPPAAFTPTVCSLPTHVSTSIAHLPPPPSVSATTAFVNTPLNIISTGSSTCLGLSISPTSHLRPPSGCYMTPISSLPDESQIDGCAAGIVPANNRSSAVRFPQQLSDCCQPSLMHFPTSTTPIGSSVVGSQQLVLCPQLIIYPPGEAGFPDLTPIPSSPVTGGRMLTSVSGEYGKSQLPPHPFVYPLSSAVATPQSLGWPQTELIPSGHQLPPIAPIHHLMPT